MITPIFPHLGVNPGQARIAPIRHRTHWFKYQRRYLFCLHSWCMVKVRDVTTDCSSHLCARFFFYCFLVAWTHRSSKYHSQNLVINIVTKSRSIIVCELEIINNCYLIISKFLISYKNSVRETLYRKNQKSPNIYENSYIACKSKKCFQWEE